MGDRKWWGLKRFGGGGKLFCFVEKENEWIENGVCINLLSCPLLH